MIQRDAKGQVYFGKWELFFQGVVLLSLLDFALETLPDLSDVQRRCVRAVELFTISVFTLEYAFRAIFSHQRTKYIFSFFGFIDLISILPFFLGLAVDLRSLRVLRMLRLFRILKLARYSRAIKRFHRAFIISREEFVLFAVSASIMLYLAGVGIYYFERDAQPDVFRSMFDGLWWAVATLTTVGFGDSYPITAGGRSFTVFILIIGLGIIAVPTGLVASALSKARQLEDDDEPDDTPPK
jgi:voltage-gated potassium channel